jgi:hypothetical protein
MSDYLIESSHTPQECLNDLDRFGKTPQYLDKFEWGCLSGEHKGWAIVEGESESAVRELVPADIRSKAHVVKVSRFTPEQIRMAHEKH